MGNFFDAPDIILTDRDSRLTGAKVPHFRNGRNITLQTVIPGLRKSIGDTVWANMHFKYILRTEL